MIPLAPLRPDDDTACPAAGLGRWQRRLADAVASHEPTADPGLRLTRAVLRSWRTYRLETSVPLTLALLGGDAPRLLDAYARATRSPSSYASREALQFLHFVAANLPPRPHALEVVSLERALVTARVRAAERPPAGAVDAWLATPSLLLRAARGAGCVVFAAPPVEVLGALLGGQPLPEGGGQSGVLLVSPVLPHGMRLASFEEADVLGRLAVSAQPVAALAAEGVDAAVLGGLARDGAVEPV